MIGTGPVGRAALEEALRLGLDAQAIPADDLIMMEADGTIVCRDGAGLALSHPAHLLLAADPEPRILPIPGWSLSGVSSLADAAPVAGEAVWVAGQGALLDEAATHFPEAGRLDLTVLSDLRAGGGDRLREISFRQAGIEHRRPADRLVLHAGVVPAVQLTRALGCAHDWDETRASWRPTIDPWGATSRRNVWAAPTDAASGRRAARGVAQALGQAVAALAAPPALPAPARTILPDDATLICPCENVSAGALRTAARLGCTGLNQLKVFTRCGMGDCQGRRCGALAADLLAAERGVAVSAITPLRVRFPLRPVTLGALAALDRA